MMRLIIAKKEAAQASSLSIETVYLSYKSKTCLLSLRSKLFFSMYFFWQGFLYCQLVRFSRGGGKSYDRGVGYQNSSGSSHNFDGPPLVTSHRDFSRSMSTDNWRDAKFAAPPPDGERDVPRGNGIQGRGIYVYNRSF